MDNQVAIGMKTFISAFVILLILLIGAGVLTRLVPMGAYEYVSIEGRQSVVPGSYETVDEEFLPVFRWFTAPIDVLFGGDGLIIITIILFLLIIGGSISILNEVQVLSFIIHDIVGRFYDHKYMLLRVIMLVFMSLGAFIGIFEEVIPLVPLILTLCIALGFNKLTGLGVSLLAAGFGFAAAVSNPFTIGVAQKIVDLPVFSGADYRLIIFVLIYLVLSTLVIAYAKKIEDKGQTQPANLDQQLKEKDANGQKAVKWFTGMMVVLMVIIAISPFVSVISSYNLPIIGLIFLVTGIGSGLFSGIGLSATVKIFGKGSLNLLPGVVLILLATGVKHVIETGQIMDTILYYASGLVEDASPMMAILMIYFLVFIMNFFIGSGSAKAFIIMPIIAPLVDMIGVSRQMSILAFQFGDGFSNILYPTNAVLLIAIGIAGVSYVDWLKWVLKYQLIIGVLTIGLLWLGIWFGY